MIDVKFKNTADAAVVLEAVVNRSSPGSKGSITVKVWGTKKWDIESPEPTKSGYYNGRTIEDSSSTCTPQSASPGFTASYLPGLQAEQPGGTPRGTRPGSTRRPTSSSAPRRPDLIPWADRTSSWGIAQFVIQ